MIKVNELGELMVSQKSSVAFIFNHFNCHSNYNPVK